LLKKSKFVVLSKRVAAKRENKFSTGVFHKAVENRGSMRNMQANTGKNEKLYLPKLLFCVKIRHFLWKSMWEMWITFTCGKLEKSQKHRLTSSF